MSNFFSPFGLRWKRVEIGQRSRGGMWMDDTAKDGYTGRGRKVEEAEGGLSWSLREIRKEGVREKWRVVWLRKWKQFGHTQSNAYKSYITAITHKHSVKAKDKRQRKGGRKEQQKEEKCSEGRFVFSNTWRDFRISVHTHRYTFFLWQKRTMEKKTNKPY